MPAVRSPWWVKTLCRPLVRPHRGTPRTLCLEYLEDRTLLSAGTLVAYTGLTFDTSGAARAPGSIVQPTQVNLYAVHLDAGDQLGAAVDALASGSSLHSLLRLFDATGKPLPLAAPPPGDPSLTFQAPAAGYYFLGVSSAPDAVYQLSTDVPALPRSLSDGLLRLADTSAGATTGSYTLDLQLTPAANRPPLIQPNDHVTRLGVSGPTDLYELTVTDSGKLTATVVPVPGLVPRLTLHGPDGVSVLVQSDAPPFPGGSVAALTQHLLPGTYYLGVSAEAGSGGYQLTSELTPATPPLGGLPTGASPFSVAVADHPDLGNGHPDLIVPNSFSNTVSVLLGNGDGSFRPQQTYAVGSLPVAVVVADVNGDHVPDLVVVNDGDNTVSVLLGNGSGSFHYLNDDPTQGTFSVGSVPIAAAVADLYGDGPHDLVVANYGDGTVSVLRGDGHGSFGSQHTFSVGPNPRDVAVADLNKDNQPDLVVVNRAVGSGPDGAVTVLLGNGPGSFHYRNDDATQGTFPVGSKAVSVTVADLNGDGKLDLAVTNSGTTYIPAGTVSVLLGDGHGSFAPQRTFGVGSEPVSVTAADLNGDGRPDLAVANYGDDTVSVLLADGQGSFRPQRVLPTGYEPVEVAVGDLNGDGRADLAVTNRGTYTVTVLLGNGDGSFQGRPTLTATSRPVRVATADVNGDGIPDVVVANLGTPFNPSTVGVLLGNGDGSLQPQRTFAVGSQPYSVAVADLNGDGRPDLVVANYGDGTLGVLLGNGDGTFQPQRTYRVGYGPIRVEVADVNKDGKPDLVVANSYDGTVGVLLGNGDGTFQKQRTFKVGVRPVWATVADVDRDGNPDLVVADFGTNASHQHTVYVLKGDGKGNFGTPQPFNVGNRPDSVAVAYLNGDRWPDLAVANHDDGTVSVLLGDGTGSFRPQQTFQVGRQPYSLMAADLNGDGRLDLATANYGDGTVSVLLGDGTGSFQTQAIAPGAYSPDSLAVADLNGDGRPDLAVSDVRNDSVLVLLGDGTGSFTTATAANAVSRRDTPLLADFNRDGTLDAVILDRSGNILFRPGLPGTNQFGPPQVLNTGHLTPGGRDDRARDLALVRTASGWAVAAADASGGSVSIYSFPNGIFSPPAGPAFQAGRLPVRIAAHDLNGDGLDDLVVADGLDNTVTVALQTSGQFMPVATLSVGDSPSDITFVNRTDADGVSRPDVVVSGQASGDVTVLLNDATHPFHTTYRFHAGPGLSGLNALAALPVVVSNEQSSSLAAGDFTGDGTTDLVAVNRGTHSFTVLAGDGHGGFANPEPELALTTSTSDGPLVNDQPGPVVAGDFNRDGKKDLAILMEDRAEVWVYTNDGQGHFTHTFSIASGSLPTGLSLVADPHTGFLDLVVGDPFGDVLLLLGNGDGTFRTPPPPPGSRVSLDVQDRTRAGQPEALVANQQADHVTVQAPQPDSQAFHTLQTLASDPRTGVLAPVGAQFFMPDGPDSSLPDAVVVNSGGNDVLVFRGTGFDAAGDPLFDPTPQPYPVGQDPVSVTIADVTGDGVPDLLVVDQGSDDVAVLFGSFVKGQWVGTPGPRLHTQDTSRPNAHGVGPLGVAVRDVTGPNGQRDGKPDLVVTNQDGTLTVLPGVGLGFFRDVFGSGPGDAHLLTIPGNPLLGAPPSFFGPSNRGVLPTAGGQLIAFNLDNFNATVHPIFNPVTNGQAIAAAQALADGSLVAVERDGTVALFQADPAGGFALAQEFTPLNGVPPDPSALAVLSTDIGLEVLVTSSAQDTVFVFTGPPGNLPIPPEEAPGESSPPPVSAEPGQPIVFVGLPESPTPTSILVPEPPPPDQTTAEPTPASEAPLTLVVTLVAGNLPEGEAGPGQPVEGEGVGTSNRHPEATLAAAVEVGGDDNEGAVQEDDTAWADEEVNPKAEDGLRGLDLYRSTEEKGPEGPVSLGPLMEAPAEWERLLTALWQTSADEPAMTEDWMELPQPEQWNLPRTPDVQPSGTSHVQPSGTSHVQVSQNGEDVVWLRGLTWLPAAEAAGPASKADLPAGSSVGVEAVAGRWAESASVPEQGAGGWLSDRRWDLSQACLMALAAGGLACWARDIPAAPERTPTARPGPGDDESRTHPVP